MATSVLILDDDEDLRVTMSEVLSATCHVECMSVPDVESMILARDRVLQCSLALLDINLGFGKPSGLDARAWLDENGFAGRIVLLTGHAATHPLVRDVVASGGVTILQKPVRSARVCALLEEPRP